MGRVRLSSLAFLEDRLALKQGKAQIYETQLSWNLKTNKYTMLPLQDPDNVDKRRSAIGLETLAIRVLHGQFAREYLVRPPRTPWSNIGGTHTHVAAERLIYISGIPKQHLKKQ